ncbi:hypothetical protein, partial [Endozoicomonas sp. YOMI1]|uniref:hypothetical protein n=1 Tax=Endozoicomonas sp. YOMI1 TaxID=2828739 RepID=UPI002147F5B3
GCVIDYANDLFDMGARLDQPEWEKAMHEAHYLQAHPAEIFQRMGDQHIKILKRDEQAFSLWESTYINPD